MKLNQKSCLDKIVKKVLHISYIIFLNNASLSLEILCKNFVYLNSKRVKYPQVTLFNTNKKYPKIFNFWLWHFNIVAKLLNCGRLCKIFKSSVFSFCHISNEQCSLDNFKYWHGLILIASIVWNILLTHQTKQWPHY